jgi:hypothetical protein
VPPKTVAVPLSGGEGEERERGFALYDTLFRVIKGEAKPPLKTLRLSKNSSSNEAKRGVK